MVDIRNSEQSVANLKPNAKDQNFEMFPNANVQWKISGLNVTTENLNNAKIQLKDPLKRKCLLKEQ